MIYKISIKEFVYSIYSKLYVLILLLGGILVIVFEKGDVVLNINEFAGAKGDSFFRYFTEIGNGWVITPFVIILFLYRYYYGTIMWISLLLTAGVSSLFKWVLFPGIVRPRYGLDEELITHIMSGFPYHALHSFPSGHTMTAFSFFTVLAICFRNKKLQVLFFVLACGVAFSRMYLLQHYFIDIYIGGLLGILNSILAVFLTNLIFRTENKRKIGIFPKFS